MKLEYSQQILKNNQISNLIKIRPARADLFHADGRTGRETYMTKLTFLLAILRKNQKSYKDVKLLSHKQWRY
jgi:hypothetical protein